MIREHRGLNRCCKSEFSYRAIPAMPFAGTAGVLANGKRLNDDREILLEDFRIGHAGIGHVRVHGIGAVESRTCTGATADGFVVLHIVIAEREVIHRALRGGKGAQCAIQRIGHALRRLDIAGNYGSRIGRAEHTVFRNPDLQRLEATLIHWYLFFDQAAKYVKHGGTRDSFGRIEVCI